MTAQPPDAPALEEDSRPVPGETCARCHTTQDWGRDSWCPNCGYYPSLDAKAINDKSWKDQIPVEAESAPEGNLFASLPTWFWIMMGGSVGILLLGLVVRTRAADEESLRGFIALTTLGVSAVVIGVAHVLACVYAMKRDRRITPMDAVVSWFSVWQPTITQLPATRFRLWSLSWGVTSAITALLIIGGIDYNAPFRTEKKVETKAFGGKAIQAVTGAAKAAGQNNDAQGMEKALGELSDPNMVGADGGGDTLEDAVNGLTETPEDLAGLAPDESETKEKAEESMLCIVYGMVMDDEQAPSGFLFAGKANRQYQHIAAINAEDLTKNDYDRLTTRLSRKIRSNSAIPSDIDAVWVDPVLVCKIRYVRKNDDGTVHGPEFESIVREGTRRSASRSAGRQ